MTNSDDIPTIFLLAAFGLYVDDDEPLSSLLCGRPIEEDAASDKTLKRALKWVQSCDTNHEGCHVHNTPLPLRVLDVGDASAPARIKLWESQEAEGTYTALSHCWGTSQHFTTTSATIDARKTGIDVTDMPKTFQDAVFITRELNVKYLWIDPLCICQDDRHEWERESSNMASIYAKSYLTIAASHASDDTIGCLNRRSPRKHITLGPPSIQGVVGFVQAFPLPIVKARREWGYISLDTEPLSRRAWALQERYLAPPKTGFAPKNPHFNLDVTKAPRKHKNTQDRYRDFKPWRDLIVNYVNRDLTKGSDKLPALSGLARHFEEQLQDQYCAGLWRKEIIQGILWQALAARPQSVEYRAPSWSWASLDGPIKIAAGLGGPYTNLAEVLDCHIELKGDDPYGEVTNGRLVLQCPTVPLSPVTESESDWETIDSASDGSMSQELSTDQGPSTKVWLRTQGGRPTGFYAVFDDPADVSAVETLPLFALLLAHFEIEWPGEETGFGRFQSLVVTPSAEQRDCFRRVGVTNNGVRIKYRRKWFEELDTLPVITLV